MAKTGRNAGLTGVVDIAGQGQKFTARIYGWNAQLDGGTRPRRGRGGGYFPSIRWIFSSGSIAGTGKMQLSEPPIPDAYNGQAGTITIQAAPGKTVSYPVIITSFYWKFDERSEDAFGVGFTASITGLPTFSGWSEAPVATDPTKSNQEQWEGTFKTIDPQGLQSTAQRVIDVWGTLTDTDAAEQTLLTDAISAAAVPVTTPHNFKLRSATFQKDAPDGGTITLVWGLTTTDEDEENAGSLTGDDASDLDDTKVISDIQTSVTPTPPATPSGLKLARTETIERNDSRFLHRFIYERRTGQEAIEMDGSEVNDDASDLADTTIIVLVKASSTPDPPSAPTGLKLRETVIRQRHAASTGEKWIHRYVFARTNREDDAEFAATAYLDDPANLEDSATIGVIGSSITPPSAPAAPLTDTKLINTKTVPVHTASGAEKWLHVFSYGVRTTAEEIKWLQSKSTAEAGALKQGEIVVSVTSSSNPGSGSNPDSTNLSLYWSQSHRRTDNKWVHVHEFRPFTATEEEQEANAFSASDPATLLVGDNQRCIVDANATAPTAPTVTDRTCIRVTTKRVGKVKYRHVYDYDFRSNAAKLVADKTRTTTDASSLASTAVTAEVWLVSGGAPSTPTNAPFVLRDTTDVEIPNPLYRLRIYEWGLITRQQELEFDRTVASADPLKVYERETASIVSHSDTAAALATTLLTANLADSTFDGVDVRRMTGARALQIIRTSGADKAIHSANFSVGEDSILGRPPNATWGTEASFGEPDCVQNVVRLSATLLGPLVGATAGLVHPMKIQRTRGGFKLRRRIITTAANLSNYYHADLIGTVNAEAFMGYGKYFIMYAGPEPQYTLALSDAHLLVLDYQFQYDSQRWMNDGLLGSGWMQCPDLGATLTSTGLVDPTFYFNTDFILTWPNDEDFSVFTA